jgi:hypothetical protein
MGWLKNACKISLKTEESKQHAMEGYGKNEPGREGMCAESGSSNSPCLVKAHVITCTLCMPAANQVT